MTKSWPSRRRASPSSISNGRSCRPRPSAGSTEPDERGGAPLRGVCGAASVSHRSPPPSIWAYCSTPPSSIRRPDFSHCCRSWPMKRRPPRPRPCCSKLVAKHPDLTEAHYALAQSAVQSDNFALALEHAHKARELGPYWAPAGLLLARVQMLKGDADEGLATARKVLEQDGQDSLSTRIRADADAGGQRGGGTQGAARAREQRDDGLGRRSARWPTSIFSSAIATARRSASAISCRAAGSSTNRCSISARSRSRAKPGTTRSQLYGRVTGGELAMAAQSRAARIKVEQAGARSRAQASRGVRRDASSVPGRSAHRARRTCWRAAATAPGALALLDAALEGISGLGGAAFRARVPARSGG